MALSDSKKFWLLLQNLLLIKFDIAQTKQLFNVDHTLTINNSKVIIGLFHSDV